MPVDSTVAVTQGLFKYAGELMAMSIFQGSPAPNWLSPIIFDVIANGLAKANISLRMIGDPHLKAIASQVILKLLRDNLKECATVEQLGSVHYFNIVWEKHSIISILTLSHQTFPSGIRQSKILK